MTALLMEGVAKSYDVGGQEVVALAGVDLVVWAGEVVALVGPSGSGKTTLLSIAGGLLAPSAGRVVVGDTDISSCSPGALTAFRREQVGFIFQSVNLIPFLSARENLLVVAEFGRRDMGAAKRRADVLLDELGLGHRRDNLPGQLSGGERQRVAIGRALMNEPALVLVDEPTSALDTKMGEQVMGLIVREVKQRGSAAVIVTHDMRMTAYADLTRQIGDGYLAPATVLPAPPPAPVRPQAEAPNWRPVPSPPAPPAGGYVVPAPRAVPAPPPAPPAYPRRRAVPPPGPGIEGASGP